MKQTVEQSRHRALLDGTRGPTSHMADDHAADSATRLAPGSVEHARHSLRSELLGARRSTWFYVVATFVVSALSSLLHGCAVEPPEALPVVQLRAFGDQELLPPYVDGARAWEAIGFEVVTEPSGLPRCDRRWYDAGDVDCELPITIERSPLVLRTEGTEAFAIRGERRVLIDSSVTDYYRLITIAAHEVGHIVLDTEQHTAGGVMGGASWTLEAVDYELACSSIGVCR